MSLFIIMVSGIVTEWCAIHMHVCIVCAHRKPLATKLCGISHLVIMQRLCSNGLKVVFVG